MLVVQASGVAFTLGRLIWNLKFCEFRRARRTMIRRPIQAGTVDSGSAETGRWVSKAGF